MITMMLKEKRIVFESPSMSIKSCDYFVVIILSFYTCGNSICFSFAFKNTK